MSGHCKCSVAFPRDAVGRSAVCDCGFSWSIHLRFWDRLNYTMGDSISECMGKFVSTKNVLFLPVSS